MSPQEWVQNIQDLRYFKMHTLRRNDLVGTRKLGDASEIAMVSLMIAHLSIQQKENGML